MRGQSLDHCSESRRHVHLFDTGNPVAERGARAVMWITLGMMVAEIAGGWWFNSMALLADGWHMSSHALALGLSVFAYTTARNWAADPRFAFGTWKVEILAGYTSAILLLCVAALMVVGSVERLLLPQPIHYEEAMWIAALGLAVNLLSAWILGGSHHHHGQGHGLAHDEDHHDGDHHHGHGSAHGHHDLNLQSAYVHVLADAATSVLAIVALAGGWLWGWNWLDPVMGIVGAVLVAVWAKGLLVDTGKILLDREMDHQVVDEIRAVVRDELVAGGATLTDLHVWRVGRNAYAAELALASSDTTLTPDRVRHHLSRHEEIVHVTVEINRSA